MVHSWLVIKNGLKWPRSVTRIPIKFRCVKDCVELVRNAPWNKHKEDFETDGDIAEDKPAEAFNPGFQSRARCHNPGFQCSE